MATDTIPVNIQVGGTGMQTWDFTGLNIHRFDTLTFRDLAPSTVDTSFPASNLAGMVMGQLMYFIHQSAVTKWDGFYGFPDVGLPADTSLTFNFEDDITWLTYPSTAGTQFSDTGFVDTLMSTGAFPALQAYADSLFLRIIFRTVSDFDAYGVLVTPAATDTVIRRYRRQIFDLDSAMANGGLFPFWTDVKPLLGIQPDTTHFYDFWAKGKNWPVAELETDGPGGNVTTARFQVFDKVVGSVTATVTPSCVGDCDGQATVSGFSGVQPYTFLWPSSAGNQTTATATGLCAATYSVTIIDAISDSAKFSFNLNEPASLGYNVQYLDSASCATCADGTINVVGTGGTGSLTYSWSNGFTGQSNNTFLPGSYNVTITDSKGCILISDTIEVSIEISGIDELISKMESVNFYPVPVQSYIGISNQSSMELIIEVFGYTGISAIQLKAGKGTSVIPVKDLTEGVYFIRAKSHDGIVIRQRRIVIKH